MEAAINNFILEQPTERQPVFKNIHLIIIEEDKTIVASIEKMMGKEMIIYKDRGMMKYALASVKNYMSLHVLPMYMSAELFSKYKSLLNKASFQKGCINFLLADEMPLKIVRQLIHDCSTIDLIKIREDQLKEKKAKAKSKSKT